MNTHFDRKNLVGTWRLKVIHQDGPMQGRTDELVAVFEPDEICIILRQFLLFGGMNGITD